MADGLLNKASIILTPTGYKAGTLYNVAPIDEPYEDFDFARTSTATRINSSGLVSNVATGVPRISYDSNGDNGHILLEPTSTNLLPYSEDFSQWTKSSGGTGSAPVITSNNSISPNGTQNADKIFFDKGIGTSVSDYSVLTTSFTSQSNTASIYIKADSPQRIVIRNSSTWEGYDIGTDWTRIEKTDTGGSIQIGLRDGYGVANVPNTATVYLWGAQVEALSYATSYIPTLTGSTVTRATETATGAGSAELINSTEGVLYAEIAALINSGSRYLGLNDGSSNNRVVILNDGTANRIRAIVSSGGTKYADLSYIVTDITDFHKVALKYKANDFALWIDGVERATDTSGSAPIGLNKLDFQLTGVNFYGKCKALAVFNEALSDAELNNLTG
jgi:hypothetical protein